MKEYKLTQFSPGAGCGCKISPGDLEQILKTNIETFSSENLLVGNDSSDDAAVYQINEEAAVISTTDFFTPIVDDPFDFGRIAATNAISDIYAMGGKPILAIAILGWPLDKLPSSIAQKVIDGARSICHEAKITLSGGHSIDISDPIFGLAVNGIIHPDKVKKNNMAKPGDQLFLTKPLGIGIVTTAEKKNIVKKEHIKQATELMTTLNEVGIVYSEMKAVNAMTDVTGFGLLGHLLEICAGSKVNAVIYDKKVPVIKGIEEYINSKAFPGGTFRNFKSYGHNIKSVTAHQKYLFCDPQTSGGLLVSVNNSFTDDFINISKDNGIEINAFGEITERNNQSYYIEIH